MHAQAEAEIEPHDAQPGTGERQTTERLAAAGPRSTARLAGVFYALTLLTGVVAVLLSGGLVVAGDPAATAANILAHERSWQLGVAAYILVVACYIAVTALLYELLRPVSRRVSLLAAFLSLVGCAVQALDCVFLLAPPVLLDGAAHLSGFTVEQVQALAYMLLQLYSPGYAIGLGFFGFYCLLIGYLILRSSFLPGILGVLMMLAGLGWLTFLFPPLASTLDPYIRLPGVVGEGSLTLWLLLMGVNGQRWQEQADAARAARRA